MLLRSRQLCGINFRANRFRWAGRHANSNTNILSNTAEEEEQKAYNVLETTRLNQYWSMTVMLYMRLLLPTGQGVAYHCTCHLPLPLIAWSMDPNRHSGQRLVTKAVCHSVPPASKQQDGLMDVHGCTRFPCCAAMQQGATVVSD